MDRAEYTMTRAKVSAGVVARIKPAVLLAPSGLRGVLLKRERIEAISVEASHAPA